MSHDARVPSHWMIQDLGVGKKVDASADSAWDPVEIIVYPGGRFVRAVPTVQSFATTRQ
jgi:hypothetical protein